MPKFFSALAIKAYRVTFFIQQSHALDVMEHIAVTNGLVQQMKLIFNIREADTFTELLAYTAELDLKNNSSSKKYDKLKPWHDFIFTVMKQVDYYKGSIEFCEALSRFRKDLLVFIEDHQIDLSIETPPEKKTSPSVSRCNK